MPLGLIRGVRKKRIEQLQQTNEELRNIIEHYKKQRTFLRVTIPYHQDMGELTQLKFIDCEYILNETNGNIRTMSYTFMNKESKKKWKVKIATIEEVKEDG